MTSPGRLAGPHDPWFIACGLALATAVFVTDIQSPFTLSIGMLYVLVILLGLWIRWTGYPWVAAGLALTLVAIDTAASYTGATSETFLNPAIMAIVFLSAAGLVTRFRRVEHVASAHVQQLSDLKRALDHSAIVATTDVSGRITYANDKFCEISGFTREELIGQDHRLINSGLHSKTFMRDLWRTIASGRVWHGEIRNRSKTGESYWVDTTIVPFLDGRGKPYQYIAIRADITARKAAEERLTQQAALTRLGQMAAVVAHEVRNPLAGIKGAMQVFLSRRTADDPETPVMRDVVGRIDALNELISDLMVFARPRSLRLSVVALRPLLTEAVNMLRRDPITEPLTIDVEGNDVPVTGDAEMIRATIVNLLINAAQAMNGHGHVTLSVSAVSDHATIEVRDTGPGIPPELRESVMEPFVTTKARGGGLGLAIAKRTAELHGGSLTLTCPEEGGTVATLTLAIRPGPLGENTIA